MKKFDYFFKKFKPKKFGYLKEPSFNLDEEQFLVEGENFRTGLWRGIRIFIEYMHGFYVFRNIRNCITVFGSARFSEVHPYYQMARDMGRKLASERFTVMTGGGPGIMEAANRGAKDMGGPSVSCNIYLPASVAEFPNAYVDKRISLHYFFVRKVMLTKYSLAFIVMPGGVGTLDELFEMSTLIQTKKMRHFPLVLMGKDFWMPLIDFMQNTLLLQGTISKEDIEELFVTDSPEEAVLYIKKNLEHIVKNNE